MTTLATDNKPSQNFDSASLRQALGTFTTGVTIVTTKGIQGQDIGLTANSFSSVSLDPPLVLWSLGKSAKSVDDFVAAEHFAVHILSEHQKLLSDTFAKRGADKFGSIDVDRGPSSIPLLKESSARFICKTRHQYEGGDHIIFVGEVIEFERYEAPPLLFHGGEYGQLKTNSGETELGQDLSQLIDDPALENATIGFLLRYCSHDLMKKLKRELKHRDLSMGQFSLLALIAKHSSCDIDKLIQLASQGDNPPKDSEIDDLYLRGYLHFVDSDVSLTDAGKQLHIELAAFYKNAEASALDALDYQKQQELRLLLAKIGAAIANENTDTHEQGLRHLGGGRKSFRV